MSTELVPVTVSILGKEYKVACPREEQSALIAAATFLDERMREIRESGKVIGGDQGRLFLPRTGHLVRISGRKSESRRFLLQCAGAGGYPQRPNRHRHAGPGSCRCLLQRGMSGRFVFRPWWRRSPALG